MNSRPALIRNTLFSTMTLGLRFASGALIFILIARALGAEEFGRFAFAVSFTGIFLVLLDYGFNLYIIKEVAADPRRAVELSNEVIGAKLLLSAASTAVLCLILRALEYPLETEIMIYALWLSSIFYSFGLFLNSIFKGLNRFQYETYPTIVLNVVLVVTIVLLLLLGYKTLSIAVAFLAARALYFGVSCFFVWRHIGRLRASLSLGKSLAILKETFPFGMHAILAAIYFQIDTVLLSLYKGDTEVGYYQAAMRLVIASMLVCDIVMSSYYSILASKFKTDPEGFRRDALSFNKYMLLIGGVFSSSLFIFPELFILPLYGAEYVRSVAIMQLLSAVIFLRFFGGPYGIFLTIADNQAKRALGVGVSVVFNVALNMLLIPWYGAMGAAVASVFTHILLEILYAVFTAGSFGSLFIDADYWKGLAAISSVALTAYALKSSLPSALITFSSLALMLLMIYAFALNVDEKKGLKRLASRLG